MKKARVLVGLAVSAGLLTVSVTTASAWFEQGPTTSGPANLGSITFIIPAGVAVSCSGALSVDEVVEVTKQAHTKLSQHLLIKEIKWEVCVIAGIISATVTGFSYQVKQPTKGQTKGIGVEIVSGGAIKAVGCEIKMEPKENNNLKELSFENGPSAEEIKGLANISGITVVASSGCEGLGIKGGKNGEMKGSELKAKDVKLV